jgi:hypothetical protein
MAFLGVHGHNGPLSEIPANGVNRLWFDRHCQLVN